MIYTPRLLTLLFRRGTVRRFFFLSLAAVAVPLFTACSDTDDENSTADGTAQRDNVNRNDNSAEPSLARLEFPRVTDPTTRVLIYTTRDRYGINYSVGWDTGRKSNLWTCYQMVKGYSQDASGGRAGYSGDFTEDPGLGDVYRVSSSNACYTGSGFDRGHLCPSADRQYSKLANAQTFYYTNMQPQYHMFNAGPRQGSTQLYTSPWVRLEDKLRSWTDMKTTDTIYVCKGGTIREDQLMPSRPYIYGNGSDRLPVPGYFFVALLRKKKDGYNAIGFWIEHDNIDHGSQPLTDYVKSIRELEELTGFDFFCNLSDNIEQKVETMPRENMLVAWDLK